MKWSRVILKIPDTMLDVVMRVVSWVEACEVLDCGGSKEGLLPEGWGTSNAVMGQACKPRSCFVRTPTRDLAN